MTLDQYLKQREITATEFARQCDLPPSTITRLIGGNRSPGLDLLKVIHRVTGGAVSPNDFLGVEERSPASEATK